MNNPEYVKIGDKKYKINTDFRVAIRCNEVAMDTDIDDIERALGIICLLYGEDGLKDSKNWQKLLDLGIKYLSLNKQRENKSQDKVDMDYTEDMDYIEASFMSDYGIDLSNTSMHWWKFSKLINGLSNSEMGNCCILNRVRNIRNMDLSKISDSKERQRIKEAQEELALKRNKKQPSKEEQENNEEFLKLLGL